MPEPQQYSAKMKFITVLMVLIGVARAPPPTAGPSKSNKADGHLYSLQEVMRIFPDTDEQNNDPAKAHLNANCYRWFEGDEDNPPKLLNKMWKQVYEMTSAARYALSEEGYKDEENRRLATRYFGISPDVVTSKKGMFGHKVTKSEVLPTKGVQLEKLLQAKGSTTRTQVQWHISLTSNRVVQRCSDVYGEAKA